MSKKINRLIQNFSGKFLKKYKEEVIDMQYIDYLKKKFEIDKVNYEAIQHLLEKKYIVWSNTNIYISYDSDYIEVPFESLLINLKQSKEHTIIYNGVSLIYNNKYIMNVKRNNITRT